MPVNGSDGRFALALWKDPDSEGDEDDCEYADEAEDLRERARLLIRNSRFRYAALYRWDGDWTFMEEFQRGIGGTA